MILLSGGIDSAACVHFLRSQDLSVSGLFVNYGQAALSPERRAAKRISSFLNIDLQEIVLRGTKDFGSGEIVGRNAALIFAALMHAPRPPVSIALAIHAGTPYYDCSRLFVRRVSSLVSEYTNGRCALLTPFLSWSKREIVGYATEFNLPLSITYSCERGNIPPCGHCLSCQDRRALSV